MGLFLYDSLVTVLFCAILEVNGVLTERTFLEGLRGARGPCGFSKGPFRGLVCFHMRDAPVSYFWYVRAKRIFSFSSLVVFWVVGARARANDHMVRPR